ncbi:MAG: UDP-2,3-diacylglucosamine diphosphatase [Phycisphaeraceae bacterium]|nr:MAG: UDP-2,3-diacylglucosamine diphosphatase [Phycisphaeraceae bacterium]
MTPKHQYRSVFISDLHLGSRSCRARELTVFLKSIRCEHLYLVGDVIDMWRLKNRWFWPPDHNDVTRRILKMAKRGTSVVYVPGNHDEHARQFVGLCFGDVSVRSHAHHTTADGRNLYITHGDEFDMIVKHARLLSVMGGMAYDWLVVVNRAYNWLRARLGLNYWSLSQFLKLKVKSACTFVAKFEETLLEEARRKGFDGVVCGHIHKPEIREPHSEIAYYNCGDWVESGTALVEHHDGTLEIIDGFALVAPILEAKASRAHQDQPPQPVHALATTLPLLDELDWESEQTETLAEPALA